MSRLYAEVDSNKHGRKATKGGDTYIRVELFRANMKIGILGLYEVATSKGDYRVVWHPVEKQQVILEDTEKANSTAH